MPADDQGGIIAGEITGRPPQNEEDTLGVCLRLVQVLNALGSDWNAPEKPCGRERGVDCVAEWKGDSKRTFEIQVVRADPNPETWRALATQGRLRLIEPAGELASKLRTATNAGFCSASRSRPR